MIVRVLVWMGMLLLRGIRLPLHGVVGGMVVQVMRVIGSMRMLLLRRWQLLRRIHSILIGARMELVRGRIAKWLLPWLLLLGHLGHRVLLLLLLQHQLLRPLLSPVSIVESSLRGRRHVGMRVSVGMGMGMVMSVIVWVIVRVLLLH